MTAVAALVTGFGRGGMRVSVADESELARARSTLRPPRTPPAPEPDAPRPFAVPDLPWQPGLEKRDHALSPREVELLELIRDGATNKQAAAMLGITEQTAKNHMSSVLAKFGVPDRTAALIVAIRSGILPLTPDGSIQIDPLVELRQLLGRITDRQGRIAAALVDLGPLVERATAALDRLAPVPSPSAAAIAAPGPKRDPDHCSVVGCEDRPVPYSGHGRPPTRCERHILRRKAA